MSEHEKTGSKITPEIISIVKKCDPNIDPASLHFKSLQDVWQYLKSEEHKVDAELNTFKTKDINLQNHMEQLHNYNDIKDVTQVVLGRLADLLNISVVEAHQRFDLDGNL